jgi:hypothetical protein
VLAEHGVTEADYAKVEKARLLIDEVNAALAKHRSPLVFAVTQMTPNDRPGVTAGADATAVIPEQE